MIATGHRTRERQISFTKGIVESRREQGARDALRLGDSRCREELQRLRDQGDEVIGTVRECRVIERAPIIGDLDGITAHLHDQGGGNRDSLTGGGHTERAIIESVEVEAGAGEGHHRVGGDGDHAIQGREDREAVASGKVHDDLARVHIRRE